MFKDVRISEYDYPLPDERIARFPLEERDGSKLLVYRHGDISQRVFRDIGEMLPDRSTLVFNNTRVIRARLIMHKPSGARIEVFCLEPHEPADYERAFAVTGQCVWKCIVGNAKKWKEGALEIPYEWNGGHYKMLAYKAGDSLGGQLVRFAWDTQLTFGQLLEYLGRIPIPPYLCRESQEVDDSRYQTVYAHYEGSVAAPTAGLHFSEKLIGELTARGISTAQVTLHVGAGTFLPVKADDVTEHHMHIEHFEVTADTLRALIAGVGKVTAVGTTSVRTLESLAGLGYRIIAHATPDLRIPVGQWELYDIPEEYGGAELLGALLTYMERSGLEKLGAATSIMIMPGFRFRVVDVIITNFHQPKSTLLLLVSAFVGENWRTIYDYAMENGFRFLSYGDSSVLIP